MDGRRSPPAGPPGPGAPGEADPLIGRTLGGHYRIEGVLGRGAMGVVYRARHTLLDQPFAVKVLPREVAGDADDPEARRRFLVEARSLALFTHRNAVQVRDCGEDAGVLYLAMDLCPGETLAALIAREGPLPEERAARIVLQVLEALDEAHRAGIVHRDLKPANVMIEPGPGGTDRVRVLDFGLARIVDLERAAVPNAFASIGGNVVGTVAYMSPEQLRAEDDVDYRSDLFSLGVVLHEALSGRLPFAGASSFSLAMRVLQAEPEPLPQVGPLPVSAPMRAVVLRALEKDRERRFATAAAFADALRGAVRGVEPPPPPPSSVRTSTALPPRVPRSRWPHQR